MDGIALLAIRGERELSQRETLIALCKWEQAGVMSSFVESSRMGHSSTILGLAPFPSFKKEGRSLHLAMDNSMTY
jgi:hypothetical protein